MLKPCALYPFKVFFLLIDGTLRDEVVSDCKCLKDQWALNMQARYGARLDGPDAMAEIEQAALLLDLDIAQIEARHASLRRFLKVRSQQVRAATVADLSAEFIAGPCRRRVVDEHQLRQVEARIVNPG